MDRDGRTWELPECYEPANAGHCRGCGQVVLWTTTKAGRKAPLNADGSSHFASCPKADEFRRRPDEPPPFEGIETL